MLWINLIKELFDCFLYWEDGGDAGSAEQIDGTRAEAAAEHCHPVLVAIHSEPKSPLTSVQIFGSAYLFLIP